MNHDAWHLAEIKRGVDMIIWDILQFLFSLWRKAGLKTGFPHKLT